MLLILEKLDYYNLVILISLIISIIYLFKKNRNYKNTHYLILSIILLVTLLEAYATYLANSGIYNTYYYNIFFVFIETNLILLYFLLLSDSKKNKMIAFLAIALFSTWYFINAMFFQNLVTHFQTNSYLLGGLLIIIFCGRVFYEIFTLKIFSEGNLLSIPHFWIITGIFFFYAVSFMHFISIQIPGIDSLFLRSISPIVRIMSCFMYLLMGLSFHFPLIFKDHPQVVAK
jgi:hypothetical protein